MNATDFISKSEYEKLKTKADNKELFQFSKKVDIGGNHYEIIIRSFINYEKIYHIGLDVNKNYKCDSLTGGRSISGTCTWFDDFSSYESAKKNINFFLKNCPDYDELEQITLF